MMTNDYHDKSYSHLTRVPLHERCINIDELTFEMVAPEGRIAQCVERQDIYLERVCRLREERADLFILFVEELMISIVPLSVSDSEFEARASERPEDVTWIIGNIGTPVVSFNFVSSKYNPDEDKSLPRFIFISSDEASFTYKLALKAFSFHDGRVTHRKHEFPNKKIPLGKITALLSNRLSPQQTEVKSDLSVEKSRISH